jgi:DNA-binding CsgD family transcriptional regulator
VQESPRLRRQQAELAQMIAQDRGVGEIALALGLSEGAVRHRISRMLQSTGTRSQAALVGWCVAHGVVTVEELRRVYVGCPAVGRAGLAVRERAGRPLAERLGG